MLEKEAMYSSRNLVQPYETAGSPANPVSYNKETGSFENHAPSGSLLYFLLVLIDLRKNELKL